MADTRGRISTPIIIMIVGLILLFGVTSTFSFKDKVFGLLYEKPKSLADVNSKLPSVDLKIEYKGVVDGVVNATSDDTPLTISWQTTGNPKECRGRSWGIKDMDKTWDGAKDPKGGTFTTKKLTINNPYVYSIDCTNETGDSDGDTVSVNIGTINGAAIAPYITDLKLDTGSKAFGSNELISLDLGTQFKINWSSLNTGTPYSVCIASGSWPTNYTNLNGSTVTGQFTMATKKVHKFTVYCSNESASTQNSLTIFAN